jgi:hypothetical protein
MTYIMFLVVLAIAALVFALVRSFGFHAKYEATFKVLGTFVAMLPVLIGVASIIFAIEIGLGLIVFGALYSTGMVRSIPHQYEIFSLYGMAIIAIGIAVFELLRYAVFVAREV